MPVLAMCDNPGCGELFSVPDKSLGQQIRCPACGKTQVVGKAAAVVAPPPAAEKQPVSAPPQAPAAAEPVPEDEESFSLAPRKEDEPQARPAPAAPPPEQPRVAGRETRRATLSRSPAAPPPKPAQAPAVIEPEVNARLDELLAEVAGGQEEDDSPSAGFAQDVLEQRVATTSILILGLLGMAAGAAAGAFSVDEHRILAAYAGAGAGWVAGFVAAMLVVILMGNIRCPACLKLCSSATGVCDACGAPLSNTRPLTNECLRAGAYAWHSAAGAVLPVVMLVIASVAVSTARVLWDVPAVVDGQFRLILLGGGVVLAFVAFAVWQQLVLATATLAMARGGGRPKPKMWSLATYGVAIKGPIAAAVYVLPLVTLPLLPILVLRMLSPADRRGLRLLDLPDCVRTVLLHPADFVVLWLALLMWATAMALAMVVAMVLLQVVPALPDWSAVQVVRDVVLTAIFGTIAAIGTITLARCIGLFGRYTGGSFTPPPPETNKSLPSDLE